MPRVSVIIPCYNAEKYLEAAIESVFSQDYDSFECLVVDDGSKDQSRQIAERLAQRHDSLKVISKDNGGRASAINYGVQHASPNAEYLVFFDADDLLQTDFLTQTVQYLDDHPQACAAMTCFWEQFSSDGDLRPGVRSRFIPAWPMPHNLRETRSVTPFIAFYCATGQGPFALIRRKAFDQTTGFEERLNQHGVHGHEDTDLYCQLSAHGEVHHLSERLYIKRTHNDNVTKTRDMGYGRFRDIWDKKLSQHISDAHAIKLIRAYYHRIHQPLRSIKVGVKATKQFCAKPSLGSLRWAFHLMRPALFLPFNLLWYWLCFLPALKQFDQQTVRIFR
ncbi:glycosyltransferase family 2 protein [Cerasicoccus frondis]|uniref:glycosyltransferase family 2 protein n=1 Tax=Cerasicoccus frondis TaxID=490090 RepID=UPI0028525F86|nr:glycosyltransferase family 2 protein [Cerasicoccus frondis]